MKLLFITVVVLLGACFASVLARALFRASPDRQRDGEWPFGAKKPLTRVEQVLFYRLVQTLPDLVVLAQVPLPAFLAVRRGSTWHEWFNRISQKSIDYLICERDFSIVLAIELDDASHDTPARITADKTKSRALTAAQIPLVRWRTTALPDVETIRRVVDDLRDGDADRSRVVAARTEPSMHLSRIDASNDPSIFEAETRR